MVVASPAYLAEAGVPRHPDDLACHAVISFRPLHTRSEWAFNDPARARRELLVPVHARFGTNSGDAAIEHALGGGGLLRALYYQVEDYVTAGRLATVLDDFAPAPAPIQAVLASTKATPARVRSFVDLAVSEARWSFGAGVRSTEPGQLS